MNFIKFELMFDIIPFLLVRVYVNLIGLQWLGIEILWAKFWFIFCRSMLECNAFKNINSSS